MIKLFIGTHLYLQIHNYSCDMVTFRKKRCVQSITNAALICIYALIHNLLLIYANKDTIISIQMTNHSVFTKIAQYRTC